jgi:hypothetical protein
MTMAYKGVVKGNVVMLEEGMTLPEGLQVEVVPMQAPRSGSPAALLEVWGSDVPDAAWDAVEQAIEEIDRTDREHRKAGCASGRPQTRQHLPRQALSLVHKIRHL